MTDEYFDELVNRGLLKDIETMSQMRGGQVLVENDDPGWSVSVVAPTRTVHLHRLDDCFKLTFSDSSGTRTYPLDVDNLVGAAIDLMKVSARP